MKRVILDTDIGIDCDDAIALALLINLAKKNLCNIEAVTTSTTRIGAISTIRAILKFYSYDTLIGKMNFPVLDCDSFELNKYAYKIMKEYNESDECEDSVKVFRKILANTNEKITVITIGPLTNIKNVLASLGDEISPKTGVELFNERVDEVYTMGGCFHPKEDDPLTEWNIVQDVKSAQYFIENCDVPITFIPSEVGRYIQTGQSLHQDKHNPVYQSLRNFHLFDKEVSNQEILSRESWDPITCYIAVLGTSNLFYLSNYGKITLSDEGITTFENTWGKHRYVKLKGRFKEVEEAINDLIVR